MGRVKGFYFVWLSSQTLRYLGLALLVAAMLAWSAPQVLFVHSPAPPLVFIDPGHGGIDGGAHHAAAIEKDINLRLALALGKELRERGYRVAYSRQEDTDLCSLTGRPAYHFREDLLARVRLAHEAGADLFISVHCNSSPNARTRGPMVFYHPQSETGKELAGALQQEVNRIASSAVPPLVYPHQPKPANFLLLRETRIPSVMVEAGFLTNPQDLGLLNDEEYRKKMARSIAQGIESFYRQTMAKS